MRIIYAITKGNWGGAQRYVYDLATHFSASHEISVIYGEGIELGQRLAAANIKALSFPTLINDMGGILRDLQTIRSLIRYFRTEKPDVLHLNSSKIGILGAIAGRLAGVPRIIFTAHGWAFNEHRPRLVRIFLKAVHYATVVLSHNTIAVSEEMRRQAHFMYGVQKKIVVIHNGIDTQETYLSKTAARERLQEKITHPVRPLWIGTISELHKNKGVDIFINAATMLARESDMPPFEIIIIGEGEERRALEQRAAENGITERTTFIGQIPDARLFIPALDIFTLSSRTESLGYVLLEAGLAKVPAVASKVGGIPEIIQNRETGLLFPSGDAGSLADTIRSFIAQPAFSQRCAENLFKKVKSEFSITLMIARTESLYKGEKDGLLKP
jgi:glycosyltransferase involved in cell wall biosynthesis